MRACAGVCVHDLSVMRFPRASSRTLPLPFHVLIPWFRRCMRASSTSPVHHHWFASCVHVWACPECAQCASPRASQRTLPVVQRVWPPSPHAMHNIAVCARSSTADWLMGCAQACERCAPLVEVWPACLRCARCACRHDVMILVFLWSAALTCAARGRAA